MLYTVYCILYALYVVSSIFTAPSGRGGGGGGDDKQQLQRFMLICIYCIVYTVYCIMEWYCIICRKYLEVITNNLQVNYYLIVLKTCTFLSLFAPPSLFLSLPPSLPPSLSPSLPPSLSPSVPLFLSPSQDLVSLSYLMAALARLWNIVKVTQTS